jgi:hypothetical protein
VTFLGADSVPVSHWVRAAFRRSFPLEVRGSVPGARSSTRAGAMPVRPSRPLLDAADHQRRQIANGAEIVRVLILEVDLVAGLELEDERHDL